MLDPGTEFSIISRRHKCVYMGEAITGKLELISVSAPPQPTRCTTSGIDYCLWRYLNSQGIPSGFPIWEAF